MKQVNDSISDKLKCIWLKSGDEMSAACKYKVYLKIRANTLIKINLHTFYELLIKIIKT